MIIPGVLQQQSSGAAPSWPDDMLASYRTLNPDQAVWFDGAGAAVQTELLARLQSGGYLHTTFGPGGVNKAVADFVMVFTINATCAAGTTVKTGDTWRWDHDGTVRTQNNWPAHTKAGAGIITLSSTDGWTGVTSITITNNKISCVLPSFNRLTALQALVIWLNPVLGSITPVASLPAVSNYDVGNMTITGNLQDLSCPSVQYFSVYNAPNITGSLNGAYAFLNLLTFVAELSGGSGGYTCSAASPVFRPSTRSINLKSSPNTTQAAIDALLQRLYIDRATFTWATPSLNIGGTTVDPSGVYQNSATPSTGNEWRYKLAVDPDAEGFNKWTFTMT